MSPLDEFEVSKYDYYKQMSRDPEDVEIVQTIYAFDVEKNELLSGTTTWVISTKYVYEIPSRNLQLIVQVSNSLIFYDKKNKRRFIFNEASFDGCFRSEKYGFLYPLYGKDM